MHETRQPKLGDVIDSARAFPTTTIIAGHMGGPLGYGPYASKKDSAAEKRTLFHGTARRAYRLD